MLNIQNLHVTVDDKPVLKGLNLSIRPGEVHAIMGPNGTGKSTLSHVLAGKDGYDITDGAIYFKGEDLTPMTIAERAQKGLFLAFQYPVEIPGVSCMSFLQTSLNAIRKSQGEEPYDAMVCLKKIREAASIVGMSDDMLKRAVNSGFSGGEKKRFEALQLLLHEPSLAIMDETDSGLDIDALRTVASAVNSTRGPKRSFLVITHYQRLLNYIEPDVVHILNDGMIVQTGGKELAHTLEQDGYDAFGIHDKQDAS